MPILDQLPPDALLRMLAGFQAEILRCALQASVDEFLRALKDVTTMAKKKTAKTGKRKVSKATEKKGHKIARSIKRSGGSVRNAFAVGMAQAKKSAAKRKRAKARKGR